VAVGVANARDVLQREIAGVRVQGAAEAVTLADEWHLGSDVKAMTAALGAVLVEQGKLTWTSRVKDVLPLTGTLGAYDQVTLEDLLAHRAGVLPMVDAADWAALPPFAGDAHGQRTQFAQWLLQQPPAATPGSSFLYSNADYVVAAAMMEQVMGLPWEQGVFEGLLTPLGLHARIGWPGQGGASQPWGHTWDGHQWVPNDPGAPGNTFPTLLNPAGNLSMSLDDALAWAQINLKGLQGVDSSVLKAASFRRLHTAVGTPSGQPGYALGWGTASDPSGNPVSVHLGSAGTFNAFIVIDAPKDRAIVLLANGDGPKVFPALNGIAVDLLK
jgi:CubicO group peptidase (beta-lactamase class C family)